MRTYRNDMPHADFPLGGIGTGTITLTAAGRLCDFQIFNRPSLGEKIPYSFFSMYSRLGDRTDARALEANPRPDFYMARGYHPLNTMGLPKFASSEMTVRYPFAEIAFTDEALPLKVKLCAFTPFIPMNADDSGIPAALFRYEVENTSSEEAEVLIASSMGNIHNYRGSDCYDNCLLSPNLENRTVRENGLTGVFMTGSAVPEDDLFYGNNAILTPDADAEVREMWYRGGWYDGITDFWTHFKQGRLEIPRESDDKFSVVGPVACVVGSVGVRKRIAPGSKAQFTFAISWYVPNRPKGWRVGDNDGATMKNYYATQFADALDAGRSLLSRLGELEDGSRRFADALYASTLPEAMLDAMASNIAVLRSTTCWRAPDGTFTAWEGSHEQEGSCHGTCTHVWDYAQTVAFLFPELEQSARRNEFMVETNPDGKMTFRTQRGFGLPDWEMYAATDGQYGTIMRAWREWKLGGDRAFLQEIYPSVLRAFDYGLKEWDSDGDGVPDARQHNTYDIEFYGPNPLCAVMMLGATRAVEEMARELGDEARVREMQALFPKAQQNFEKLCWQGEYYVQRLDDVDKYPYQFGVGCLSDQLLGQTIASISGLGNLLPAERLDSAIRAVYRYNFLDGSKRNPCMQRLYVAPDEPGLVLCSWPDGGTPRFPFVYSDEVWTGIEYQVATLMIYRGMAEEAEKLVKAVRQRFDGVRRSPWSEMECGHYYARAMASWGLLAAMSGFDCNTYHQEMTFAPVQPNGTLFWSMGSAWGNVSFRPDGVSIAPKYGTLRLRKLTVPGLERLHRARVGGRTLDCTVENGALVLRESLTLSADETLSLEFA